MYRLDTERQDVAEKFWCQILFVRLNFVKMGNSLEAEQDNANIKVTPLSSSYVATVIRIVSKTIIFCNVKPCSLFNIYRHS